MIYDFMQVINYHIMATVWENMRILEQNFDMTILHYMLMDNITLKYEVQKSGRNMRTQVEKMDFLHDALMHAGNFF